MTKPLKIFFVGEVSAGKSSLLNAIAGGIISNASIQRETINPEIYPFVSNKEMKAFPSFKKAASLLEKKHRYNKEITQKKEIKSDSPKIIMDPSGKPIYFKTKLGVGDFEIIDFPGLNDSTDSNGIFFHLIEENIMNCDCLVYVTKAESAFLSQSEVDLFKRLKLLCEVRRRFNGQYIKLCIIINKFDDPYNSDLTQIADDIPNKLDDKETPIFRISSHKLFIANITKHKLVVPIPKFTQQEIQKIFQNANVITTKDQKKSIKNDGKISHRYIKFNENIESNDDNEQEYTEKKSDKTSKKDNESDNSDDSDSGSAFEDDYVEEEKIKPTYKYNYEGDWNKFIDFIKEENKDNIQNMKEIRNEWIKNFLDSKPDFNKPECAEQFLNFYHTIYQKFKKESDMENFIKETQTFILDNFDNDLLICSIIKYLFSNHFMFTVTEIKILSKVILDRISTYIQKSTLRFYHIYLVVKTLEKIGNCYEKDILKILQNEIIWEARTDGILKYYDPDQKTCVYIENGVSPTFRTNFVERIYNIFLNNKNICFLITLCLIKHEHLLILHTDNKIPYGLITKFLGKTATIRFKTFVINKIIDEGKIPILFNNDPENLINKKVNEYIKIESMIDKLLEI